MKTVGIMTLLSVAVTAVAPGREAGKENAAVASSISQPHAGCPATADDSGCVALTERGVR
jgi:hypothetical protein